MNTKKIPRNKLSIYLIKEELSSAKNEGLLNAREKGVVDIKEIGEFHYGYSEFKAPPWLKKFFGKSFDNNVDEVEKNRDKEKRRKRKEYGEPKHRLFSATASGIFFVDAGGRKFAITFGYGRAFLKNGVYEEHFGLKSALNLIQENSFRAIEKKNMVRDPKLSTEQFSRNGDVHNFILDTEQDILLGITGKSSNPSFGNIVTGKDALSISVEGDVYDIDVLLCECLKIYKSDKYKEGFSWIDHTSAIKSQKIIEELDDQLIDNINRKKFNTLWMSIPEIIQWDNFKEFRFNKNSFGDDIELEKYLRFNKNSNNLLLDDMKKHLVECISKDEDNILHSWKIYQCLYCEIEGKDKVNILSGGRWYEVETSFTKKIQNSFNKIRDKKINLPLPKSKYEEHEDLYNERAGEELNEFSCMDKELVPIEVGGKGIEFGDLLTIDGKIIHVKRGTNSSVLSHLFAQGVVSGTLFNEEENFRKNLSAKLVEVLGDKLGNEYKKIYTDNIPDPRDYKIIYAIISKQKGELKIPFFSKINIRNAKKRLEGMGYKVYLYHIPIDKNDVCIKSNERRKKRKSKK